MPSAKINFFLLWMLSACVSTDSITSYQQSSILYTPQGVIRRVNQGNIIQQGNLPMDITAQWQTPTQHIQLSTPHAQISHGRFMPEQTCLIPIWQNGQVVYHPARCQMMPQEPSPFVPMP